MDALRSSILLLVIALSFSIPAAVSGAAQCGVPAVEVRELVTHGKPTQHGQWPWHGALYHRIHGTSPTYACGLTVVSQFYTITAAHCTYPERKHVKLAPSQLLVYLGISNLENPGFSLQKLAVKSIVRHENYQTKAVGYDIALLKVAPGIEFNNHVRPICFWSGDASEAIIVGKNGYSPGWGCNENDELPPELRLAVMPIVSREHCRNSNTVFYTPSLFDRMAFCAGFRNGTSVGNGDSGGGLYIQRNGIWFLRGIVSHAQTIGAGKTDTSNYVVYMDAAYFLPWIQRTLDIPINDDEFSACGKLSEAPSKPDADHRPWPWHGQVFRNGSRPELLGDVAIINRSFVLTQASIFNHSDYKDPLRLLVKFHATKNNIDKVLHSVHVKVIVPFTTESHEGGNNVAILELLEPLLFSENIRPICLWQGPASITAESISYVGNLQVNPSQDRSCVNQHPQPLDVLPNSLCITTTKREYIRLSHNILYMRYNETWYARGISYEAAKRGKDYSILYLDMTFYSSWIRTSIAIRSEMLLPLSTCSARSTQEWNLRLRGQSLQCYGSLVTPYLVLTTAACINDMDPRYPLQIGNANGFKYVSVLKSHIHPMFHEVHLTNNIGLIQLEKPFDAEPICIPKETTPGQELLFNSWDGPAVLNETLMVTDIKSCAQGWLSLGSYVSTEGGHICGQLPEPAVEFDCQINLNGSPLTYLANNRRFLRGILDFGKQDHCAQDGLPEVFHDLRFYHNWIVEVYGKTTHSRIEEDANLLAANEKSENLSDVFKDIKPQIDLFGQLLKEAVENVNVKELRDPSGILWMKNAIDVVVDKGILGKPTRPIEST